MGRFLIGEGITPSMAADGKLRHLRFKAGSLNVRKLLQVARMQ